MFPWLPGFSALPSCADKDKPLTVSGTQEDWFIFHVLSFFSLLFLVSIRLSLWHYTFGSFREAQYKTVDTFQYQGDVTTHFYGEQYALYTIRLPIPEKKAAVEFQATLRRGHLHIE